MAFFDYSNAEKLARYATTLIDSNPRVFRGSHVATSQRKPQFFSSVPYSYTSRCDSWSADLLAQQIRDFPAQYHTHTPLER